MALNFACFLWEESQRDVSKHTSTSADIYSFTSFRDSRDRRPTRETFIRRNGRDRTRSRWSRITAAQKELSAGNTASIPNASEIVSRRDRNYPSQSLVGNISDGWHAKTRTDVHLPTNGWMEKGTEDTDLGISYAPFLVCTVWCCRRWLPIRRGRSGNRYSSTWRYLFTGVSFNHLPCSWLTLSMRILFQ